MVNKVILVGRICTDIEMKYTPSGIAVASIRLAVDRNFNNAAGERETDFVDVVLWRKDAEFANQYLGKGRLVLIEGRLQVRQWEKDGQKRRNTEVVADNLRALDKPKDGAAPQAPPTPEAAGDDFSVPDISDPFAGQ